ncbi:MAG: hypothetical protein ACI8ZN_002728 [Bacteroidia bacterium]|jgi:hypothetical protein
MSSIRSTTELFKDVNSKTPIGLFARGSRVEVLSTHFQMAYVETNSRMRGYVQANFLTKHLMGNDVAEPDPIIFRGGRDDRNYDNLGMYVQVAGLRARVAPSGDSAVALLLKMNERCDIDFLPYNKDGWVRAGGKYVASTNSYTHFFVQRKYLGVQANIEEKISAYLNETFESMQAKQTAIERIFEMSYFEGDSLRAVALQLFRSYAEYDEIVVDFEAIDFELFALENTNHWMDHPTQYEVQRGKYPISYQFHDALFDPKSEADIRALKLEYTVDKECPEDLICGWGFEQAFYLNGITAIDEGEYGFSTWKVDFQNSDFSIQIGDFNLNSNTSEFEFLVSIGKLFSPDLRDGDHRYYLHGDAEFYVVEFKDGKPMLWKMDYHC